MQPLSSREAVFFVLRQSTNPVKLLASDVLRIACGVDGSSRDTGIEEWKCNVFSGYSTGQLTEEVRGVPVLLGLACVHMRPKNKFFGHFHPLVVSVSWLYTMQTGIEFDKSQLQANVQRRSTKGMQRNFLQKAKGYSRFCAWVCFSWVCITALQRTQNSDKGTRSGQSYQMVRSGNIFWVLSAFLDWWNGFYW